MNYALPNPENNALISRTKAQKGKNISDDRKYTFYCWIALYFPDGQGCPERNGKYYTTKELITKVFGPGLSRKHVLGCKEPKKNEYIQGQPLQHTYERYFHQKTLDEIKSNMDTLFRKA